MAFKKLAEGVFGPNVRPYRTFARLVCTSEPAPKGAIHYDRLAGDFFSPPCDFSSVIHIRADQSPTVYFPSKLSTPEIPWSISTHSNYKTGRTGSPAYTNRHRASAFNPHAGNPERLVMVIHWQMTREVARPSSGNFIRKSLTTPFKISRAQQQELTPSPWRTDIGLKV